MKKIVLSVLLLSPVALFAQTNFSIKCKLGGQMETLKKAYVNYNNGEKYAPVDSIEIKNGEFEYSGTMKDDEYNSVRFSIGTSFAGKIQDNKLALFVKKGDNIIVNIPGDIHSAVITGSKQSEVYQLVDDSLAHTKDVGGALVIFKRLFAQYPDSKMSLKAFLNRFGMGTAQRFPAQLNEILNVYNMLLPRVRSTKDGTVYGKYLEDVTHIVVGGTLADFTSKTPQGKVIRLSDLRGKYVLVDFWASWCVPCRAEFPYLKKAYATFKDKNFEILGYSIDNDKSLWVSALENDDVPWLNVSNLIGTRDPIALAYQVNAVPSNFLISPEGKVIAINLRGELLAPALAKYINKSDQ